MTLDDALKLAATDARYAKEAVCKDDGDGIYSPLIDVYRDQEPVAILGLRHHRPPEILTVCEICVLGFDADLITVSFEGYEGVDTAFRRGDVNPATGKGWLMGEMADHAQNHDGLAKGYVTETLTVLAINRAGDLACTNMWFRFVDGVLTWTKEFTFSTVDIRFTATDLVKALISAMVHPSTSVIFPPEAEKLDRTGKDMLIAKLLSSEDCGIGLYSTAGDTDRINRMITMGKRM